MSYWQRLKSHPGVPMASFWTAMGFFAGIGGDTADKWIGAAMFSVFWIPVLLTNRESR